jgi:hypothetical protein
VRSLDVHLPAGPNSWERSVATSPVGGIRARIPVRLVGSEGWRDWRGRGGDTEGVEGRVGLGGGAKGEDENVLLC